MDGGGFEAMLHDLLAIDTLQDVSKLLRAAHRDHTAQITEPDH